MSESWPDQSELSDDEVVQWMITNLGVDSTATAAGVRRTVMSRWTAGQRFSGLSDAERITTLRLALSALADLRTIASVDEIAAWFAEANPRYASLTNLSPAQAVGENRVTDVADAVRYAVRRGTLADD